MTLEQELGTALQDLYEKWKEIGYTAKRFKQMLTPGNRTFKGPVGTVKHLMSKKLSEESGFLRLVKADRLEWTVEALISDEKWHPLFDEWEIERARQRIAQRGESSQLAGW